MKKKQIVALMLGISVLMVVPGCEKSQMQIKCHIVRL